MTKLPIFIFSGKSPIGASGGGYSTYAYNLARILKTLGYPVYILALGEGNRREETEVGTLILSKAAIPFLNVNIYALPGLPIYGILFANGVRKIVKEEKYKKFIVWGIGPWGFACALLKKIYGKKVVYLNNYFTTTRHEWWGGVKALKVSDYGFWPRIKYWLIYLTIVQYLFQLEKFVLKTADKIITNYQSTEEILKKEFQVNSKKFYRAHFYVQVYKRNVSTAIEGNEIKLPKKYILFLSRQDPRKGVNFLLHAMKILIDKDYKVPLLIAGGGDMLPANKKLADKLKINKWVKFLGFVNDPKPLMKKCSVFVFPSIEEGAGALTVNEAMKMGLPIISTACDGIIEDIKNNQSGILVPMENPSSLAEAIAQLLDNPSFAKKLGKFAKETYEKRFTFDKMKKDIQKLLTSLEGK